MIIESYATTICRNYNLVKTIDQVLKQEIIGSGQVTYVTNVNGQGYKDSKVKMVTPGLAEIVPFAHPIVVRDKRSDDYAVYVDVRNYMRLNQVGTPVIHAHSDYALTVLRGLMQSNWIRPDDRHNLMSLGDIPVTFFSRWLSDILTIRLNLTPDIQSRVSVIIAYYYLNLFLEGDDSEVPEDIKVRFGSMIARATYVSIPDVYAIIDELPRMFCTEDLIKSLVAHSNTTRFEKLTLAFLYTAVSGSWFGSNAREIVSIALEHPPTWIALVFSAINERGYKNTAVGRIAQNMKNNDAVAAFGKSMQYIIGLNEKRN